MEALVHPDGSEFDRAHQESFLLHLLGVKDALLAELNAYYGANITKDLSLGKLRDRLKTLGKKSGEVAELFALEKDENSWFSIAKAMRDYTTHEGGISRAYYAGGPDHRKVS